MKTSLITRLLCGLNVTLGMALAQPSTSAEDTVPLGSAAQFTTVQASINGQGPYTFVIDTGVGGALHVTPEVMQALKLKQTGMIQDGDLSGRDARALPVVQVASLQVGKTRLRVDSAVVGGRLPGVNVDGVIGLKAFQGLTVSLDFPHRNLHLSSKALPEKMNHAVPYRLTPAGPAIEINAAGKVLSATLDSGGPGVLSVPRAGTVPLAGDLRVIGRGRTATGEFEVQGAPLAGTLSVAGWKVERPVVQVVERLPIISLGAEFLRAYQVTFDTVQQRVAFNQ